MNNILNNKYFLILSLEFIKQYIHITSSVYWLLSALKIYSTYVNFLLAVELQLTYRITLQKSR